MAKNVKSVSELLEEIDTKKPAEAVKIAKELGERLIAEEASHQQTIDTHKEAVKGIADEAKEAKKKLASEEKAHAKTKAENQEIVNDLTAQLAKANGAKGKSKSFGEVEHEGKKGTIMFAEFSRKGKTYTAADVLANTDNIVQTLIDINSAVIVWETEQ